ncbi:putative TetR-family transcriptional regulator [Actinoplanes missouriensis 431]|uniref:Putative TetR-family transcriptional regulator n=1 Tax=Actinoplanes missouriensis (strain ATCC 14538 / DSM 43046 / CBS 188.64 / JCM 3121 / NBRC 102363 / NCIMB 12654 / NRRL B-3342 / UNCC 431) TaxID=512565 RepID=I0H4L8_ACTM4|nr:TetR/AcrR family transcriptional regulator [Actinoplanes missouriensis]BAL87955.1 putative TetR-family transcriptional regulator [Actinoplanes missouriensis 431]
MTDTTRRPATRDKERTRQAVIAATERLVQERGMRFSIADVAAAAEISKGGVLYHFTNRDALLVAVVEHAIARFHSEVMRHTDITENRAGKLLRGYVRALCGGSDEAVQVFAPFTHWAGIEEIPEIAELLRADAAWWRTALLDDGLPAARTHSVRFAAEGVAAAITTEIAYITADDLALTRAALLELAEPDPA